MNADIHIIEREKAFWTGSVDYYERWLARDVLMVFPVPAGVLAREDVLAGIRAGTRWLSVEMTDITVRRPGEFVFTLAYRARAQKSHSLLDYAALIGSVYVLEDGEWKLAFHQHTPLDEPKNA